MGDAPGTPGTADISIQNVTAYNMAGKRKRRDQTNKK
jgi:hypothetical protein